MLLVPSWHVLLPDGFLQSKYFGAKQLGKPELQLWELIGLNILKGTAAFSPSSYCVPGTVLSGDGRTQCEPLMF